MSGCRNTWAPIDSAWGLPDTVMVAGQPLAVNTDYRVMLTVFAALNDPELTPEEKSWVVLNRFYRQPEDITDPKAALEAFARFADCGSGSSGKSAPRLMDWQKDYPLLAPAVDRVLGYSSRQCPHLHWWEYLGAFREVGDGLFAQVVAVRSQQAKGKQLTPAQAAFVRANPELIRLPQQLTGEEQAALDALLEPLEKEE